MLKPQTRFVAYLGGLLVVVALIWGPCKAQDYDDEGYGNQAGNGQGDSDGYGSNDDGYNVNSAPNYQQGVDSDGSNNQPSGYLAQGGGSGGAGSSDADGDYEGDDGSAAASSLSPTIVRVRRSLGESASPTTGSSSKVLAAGSGESPKVRVKRHGKYYIGPVYTYVKTDKHANFKWGVKHKVGKKHYG